MTAPIPTPGARRLATLTAAGAPASLRRLVGKALRLFGSRHLLAPGTTEGCRDAIHALGLSLIQQPIPMVIGERGGLTIGLADSDRYQGADHLDARLLCPACRRAWKLAGITRLETLDGAIAGHVCMEAA